MVKAVLFDFDGTLVDTAPGIVKTMQGTFLEMGLAVPDESAVRQTIGLPLFDSLKHLGNFSDEDARRGVEIYRRLFATLELGNMSVFPGVAETLKELSSRGVRMAICTSRGQNSLHMILSSFGLEEYFEDFVTASDGLRSKPAPDPVFALLERMKLRSDETLVVGDTTFDIQMGAAAGCRTVAVTYGNHSREKLESVRPDFLTDAFRNIPDYVSETVAEGDEQ